MKRLLVINCLIILSHVSFSQNNTTVYKTFKSGTAEPKDIKAQQNYSFASTTGTNLHNSSFFVNSNSETTTTFRTGFEMPGYYQPGEMMSRDTKSSAVGNVKFYCNYYFDADGQLQDGDITISKIK